MDQYAVVGNPIAHSKSPDIHYQFALQTGEILEYHKILVAKEAFREEATAFFALGGRGLNVTVPFKETAFRFSDHLTERAQLAEAVNTLVYQSDGTILGDNTDGAGLMMDLARLQWPLAGARVLVLGAGGAVRGILQPLLAANPSAVVIANRTEAKAQALAKTFEPYGEVQGLGFAGIEGAFDVVINGSSASLAGEMPPISTQVVTNTTRVYDLMYAAEPTVFMRWALEARAADTSDGLGMLVGQAAEAFYLWRGKRPDIVPVLTWLRAQLDAA